jgi:hypothetical protein
VVWFAGALPPLPATGGASLAVRERALVGREELGADQADDVEGADGARGFLLQRVS